MGELLGCKKKRVWELDFLRGLCIVLVVFDHVMMCFCFLPGWTNNWAEVGNPFFEAMVSIFPVYWYWGTRTAIRASVISLFAFISGISCSFSKSNGDRFLKLAAAASVLTLATAALTYVIIAMGNAAADTIILFGIIHVLGAGTLLYIVIRKLCPRTPILRLVVGGALTVGGIFLHFWEFPPSKIPYLPSLNDTGIYWTFLIISIGFVLLLVQRLLCKRFARKEMSNKLYAVHGAIIGIFLLIALLLFFLLPKTPIEYGHISDYVSLVIGTGRYGGDYQGIMPYAGIFLLGSVFGELFYAKRTSLLPGLDGRWNHGFVYLGKHTIRIFLFHLAFIMAILMFIGFFVGYRFF